MMLKSPLGSSNCWKRWSYLFWKFNLRSLSFSLTSSFSDFRNEFFCGDFNDRFINSQILYFGYRQTGRRKPHIAHSLVFSKVSLVKVRVLVASWKYGTFLRWSRTFGQANELLHPPEKTIMFGDGRRNIFSISETCISQKISQYTVSQFFTKHLLISVYSLATLCFAGFAFKGFDDLPQGEKFETLKIGENLFSCLTRFSWSTFGPNSSLAIIFGPFEAMMLTVIHSTFFQD